VSFLLTTLLLLRCCGGTRRFHAPSFSAARVIVPEGAGVVKEPDGSLVHQVFRRLIHRVVDKWG
jgi:hypothetical protein